MREQMLAFRKASLSVLASLSLLFAALGPAAALETGELAPEFRLPTLAGEREEEAPALFEESELTALVFWNHGCPRCTEIAMHVGALADSLRPLGVRTLCVLFGPDDPAALRNLLSQRGVTVPHLWDESGSVAAQYGLGQTHLRSFLIDRRGIVRAVFDDEVPDLVTPIVPAARRLRAVPAPPSMANAATSAGKAGESRPSRGISPPELAAYRLDARMRVQSTEGALQVGGVSMDTGLFGESLENGLLALWRLDFRLPWSPVRGIEFEPWLRFSNESEEILTQGPEQFSNAHGTATLRAHGGPFAAVVGAFPLRLSPLLLQRWDAQDAPPLGGVSSCGCGPGASSLSQRSLEVLTPFYTFEGGSASITERYGRVRGFLAIPRWEKRYAVTDLTERMQSRYRRILQGASIDLGPTGTEDPRYAVPAPVGLRGAVLRVGDDTRTVARDASTWRPEEWDETGWVIEAAAGPRFGVGLEGEHVWWRLKERPQGLPASPAPLTTTRSRAWRAGVRGEWPLPFRLAGSLPVKLWGEAYHIRTGKNYEPLYRALTYDPNREGWRFSGGLGLFPEAGAPHERLGITAFYRPMREAEAVTYPGEGRIRSSVTSVTLLARPIMDLLAETHAVRTRTDYPVPGMQDLETRGLSFDVRWEGWPAIDPLARMDVLSEGTRDGGRHTVWQWVLSLRLIR